MIMADCFKEKLVIVGSYTWVRETGLTQYMESVQQLME